MRETKWTEVPLGKRDLPVNSASPRGTIASRARKDTARHWTSARGGHRKTGLEARHRIAGLGIERVALVVWWSPLHAAASVAAAFLSRNGNEGARQVGL